MGYRESGMREEQGRGMVDNSLEEAINTLRRHGRKLVW